MQRMACKRSLDDVGAAREALCGLFPFSVMPVRESLHAGGKCIACAKKLAAQDGSLQQSYCTLSSDGTDSLLYLCGQCAEPCLRCGLGYDRTVRDARCVTCMRFKNRSEAESQHRRTALRDALQREVGLALVLGSTVRCVELGCFTRAMFFSTCAESRGWCGVHAHSCLGCGLMCSPNALRLLETPRDPVTHERHCAWL